MTDPIYDMPGDVLDTPVWTIDGFTFPGTPTLDDRAREWFINVDGEEGWLGGAAPRTSLSDRSYNHGAFRGVSFRGSRSFKLEGTVTCPNSIEREKTERELAAICADGRRVYAFRRTLPGFDLVSYVELDDAPLIAMKPGGLQLTFSLQFVSTDARIHTYAWQEPISTVPLSTGKAVDFGANGLDFGSGVDFGTALEAAPLTATVSNFGTAPVFPLLVISNGMINNARIEVSDGAVIQYNRQLDAGEKLYINCDDFYQKDMPPHCVMSSEYGNVRTFATIREWVSVMPNETKVFTLSGTSVDYSTQLQVFLRSAYL